MFEQLHSIFGINKETIEHEHLMFEAEAEMIDVLQSIDANLHSVATSLLKLEGRLSDKQVDRP